MAAYQSGVPIPVSSNLIINDEINDDAKEVFHSTGETTQVSTSFLSMQPEEKTDNQCIKSGCLELAIISSEWDGEYCSNECAVGHCKDVFAAWVVGGS